MTLRKRLTEAELERLRVEQITLETGGGLSDTPWEGRILIGGEWKPFKRSWIVDGIPDGYGEGLRKRDWRQPEETFQSTYYLGGVYGTGVNVGERVIDANGVWELVATFGGATEVECPARTYDHETGESTSSNKPRKVTRADAQLTAKPERRDSPRWYGDKRPNARRAECLYCENRVGEEHGYLGDDYTVVEVWKRIAEKPERDEIVESMARSFFVDAYANHVDECKGCLVLDDLDEGDHAKPGPGEDWFDYAPELVDNNPFSEEARAKAEELAVHIEKDNGADLVELYLRAVALEGEHESEPTADRFGHYLMMEAVGHGVSWGDSHPDHELKLPNVESMYL